MPSRKVLVTGATGYIGGRLVPELLAAGHEVRCFARSPDKLSDEAWCADVDVVEGDIGDPESLKAAMDGTEVAYMLVHSMGGSDRDFARPDRQAAEHVRDAAAAVGLQRIVYLGGLGADDDPTLRLTSVAATRSGGSSPRARRRSPSSGRR